MSYHITYSIELYYPFTGKERDRETGFSYFGARYYDSDLSGLFLSVDPMADKYPNLSPYAYCAWNPVKLVDPKGREIWIVSKAGARIKYENGMSSEGFDNFTAETILALNKLCTTQVIGKKLGQISKIQQFVIDIRENNQETFWAPNQYENDCNYLPSNQTIDFAPYLGIEDINTGEILSPANCLGHEFGHIISAIENPELFFDRQSQKRTDEWTNEEELYNITNIENKISLEWNELIREGHKNTDCDGIEHYRVIQTDSSISANKTDL